MPDQDIVPAGRQLSAFTPQFVPTLFTDAGERAVWRFLEFFAANIRNPNTREAYARAVTQFADWCALRKLRLADLSPFVVAAYIEERGRELSAPTVKQHLAALRMLFDWLVVGQVIPLSPAASVRGPKHIVHRGKTPVLAAEEARLLLDSIETDTIAGLRDRALIGVMVFSLARVGAVVAMDTEDYFPQGKRFWFRLHEKGGKRHEIPAHHKAEEYLDAYLAATGISAGKGAPLFRTLDRRRQLTERRIGRREVLAMVKRRSRQAGLPAGISCHTFRATGITVYLQSGGTLEKAQQIANHSSPRTTKLYDRTSDEVSLDEIEKILI